MMGSRVRVTQAAPKFLHENQTVTGGRAFERSAREPTMGNGASNKRSPAGAICPNGIRGYIFGPFRPMRSAGWTSVDCGLAGKSDSLAIAPADNPKPPAHRLAHARLADLKILNTKSEPGFHPRARAETQIAGNEMRRWTVYHVDFTAGGNSPLLTEIGSVEADNLLAAVMKAQALWPEERSMIVRPAEDSQSVAARFGSKA